jgi:hypothetical protein
MTSRVKFFPVSPGVWGDFNELDHTTMLVYLYVLSCPHRFSEGLYRLPVPYVAADLNLTPQEATEALERLRAARKIEYDSAAGVVFDRSALTVLPPKSPEQIKGAIRKLRQVPRTPLLVELHAMAAIHSPLFAEAIEEDPLLSNSLEDARAKHSENSPGSRENAKEQVRDSHPDTSPNSGSDSGGDRGSRHLRGRVLRGADSAVPLEPQEVASEFEGEVAAWGRSR